jgi:hypothetical protein
MKICPVGVELFHADGRTDMTMLIAASLSIAKAPNKMCSDIFTVISTSKLRAVEARVAPINAYTGLIFNDLTKIDMRQQFFFNSEIKFNENPFH